MSRHHDATPRPPYALYIVDDELNNIYERRGEEAGIDIAEMIAEQFGASSNESWSVYVFGPDGLVAQWSAEPPSPIEDV